MYLGGISRSVGVLTVGRNMCCAIYFNNIYPFTRHGMF